MATARQIAEAYFAARSIAATWRTASPSCGKPSSSAPRGTDPR
jgi:hypothetical protein